MLKIDIHFLPFRDPFLLQNTDDKIQEKKITFILWLHPTSIIIAIWYDGHIQKYINNKYKKNTATD